MKYKFNFEHEIFHRVLSQIVYESFIQTVMCKQAAFAPLFLVVFYFD